MVEDTVLSKSDADGEEVEVETLTQVPPGENVRAAGSDVRAGTRVLGVGDIVKSGGGELGSLAFIGKRHVKVYRKPVVAILSTGNELVDIGSAPTSSIDGAWGGIFDTNRPALSAAMKGMGYEVLDLGIMRDECVSFSSIAYHELTPSEGKRQ
jgi:gephyrin